MKNNTLRVSTALLAIPLVALLLSSAGMVSYVQEDVRSAAVQQALKYPLLCEFSIHEAGFARIALGGLGLFVLLIPYRKGEFWAWFSLLILLMYQLAVFAFPARTSLLGWDDLRRALVRPELPRSMLLNLAFPGLMLLGLGMSLPSFLHSWRGKGQAD